MTTTTAAAEVVQAYHDAWTSGDIDRAVALLADSAVCHAPDPDITTKADWRPISRRFHPDAHGSP